MCGEAKDRAFAAVADPLALPADRISSIRTERRYDLAAAYAASMDAVWLHRDGATTARSLPARPA